MDESRTDHSECWFICKYCDHIFRDKLELFCHQVNEHPEYRQQLTSPNSKSSQIHNNGNRNLTNVTQILYSNESNSGFQVQQERPKQQPSHYLNSIVQPTLTSASTLPLPSSSTSSTSITQNIENNHQHYENVQNYYTISNSNPVEYYVVLPNQLPNQNQNLNQSQSYIDSDQLSIANASSAPNLVSIPSSAQFFQIGPSGNLTFLETEEGGEFHGQNANHQYQIQVQPELECVEPEPVPEPEPESEPLPTPIPISLPRESVLRFSTNKKPPQKRKRIQENSKNNSKIPKTTAAAAAVPVTKTKVANTTVATKAGTIAAAEKEIKVPVETFPCTYCGLTFPSRDQLSSHLFTCKGRKLSFENYQYKCMKCSQSFEVYHEYKKHIAVQHTAEVLYS